MKSLSMVAYFSWFPLAKQGKLAYHERVIAGPLGLSPSKGLENKRWGNIKIY
jgi:hypothetical protein